MFELFSNSLILIIFMLFLSYIVGQVIPKNFYFENISHNIQSLCYGYTILVFLFGISFVYSIPRSIIDYLLVFIISLVVMRVLIDNKLTLQKMKFDYGILVVPINFIFIVFTPFIFGAIFFGNFDPGDLHGFAVGYLKVGDWDNLYQSWNLLLGSEKTIWQSSGDQYSFSDYRLAVAFDYLVYSIRWGMPVIANWINQIFNQEIYVGIFVASVLPFLISPLLIYDFFKKSLNLQYSTTALFLTFLGFGVSTPVLLWHEGLLNHIAVLPIFFLMLMIIDDIFKNPNVKKIFIFSFLFVVSVTLWAEAPILIIIYSATYCCVSFLELNSTYDRKNYLRKVCYIFFYFVICAFFIFPEAFLNFINLCLNRLNNFYPPGILAFDWSLLNIIIPLPLVWIDENATPNIQFLFNFSKYYRIIEATILLSILFYLYKKNKNLKQLFVVGLIIFVFSLLNKPYIYWNAVSLLLPIIALNLYTLLSSRYREIYLKKYFIFITLFGLISMQFFQFQYSDISKSIKPSQFILDDSIVQYETRIAILTPSLKNGYLRYGWNNDLHWVNKTVSWFGQIVSYRNTDQNRKIAYYYDCDIEGHETCELIRKNKRISDKKIYLSNILVSDICDENGNISQESVMKIKESFFGKGITNE